MLFLLGYCSGSLISSKFVATAFHCTSFDGKTPCDHSDGKRVAVIGAHSTKDDAERISIIKVLYPPNISSHDFAICVLKHPAKWSHKVQPICLPPPNKDFYGLETVAAGWGMTRFGFTSPNLLKVDLIVDKKYSPQKFGTKLDI